jgi:MFS family permease
MTSPSTPAPRLAALRHRDFRLLWGGGLVSEIGSQMQIVAINWQVYQLLRGDAYTLVFGAWRLHLGAGALGLGLLGLARVVPILLLSLLGGLVADTLDRRTLIVSAQIAAAAVSALLAALTLTGHVTIAALYLLTALDVAVSAFDEPAQQALVPHLVPRAHLTNAVSLFTLVWQIGTVVGPGLAGLVIARASVGVVYAINAASFVAVVLAVWALRYRGRGGVGRGGVAATGVSVAALREGLRFTRRTRLVWSTMLLDFYATFFSSARTMLPIVADRLLHAGAPGYGLLATAQPLGAVLAGVALALRRDIRRQGVALLVGVAVYGVATALFGVSTIFAVSYALFALTGAGDTVSTVIRATLRQTLTPDHLRGRIASVHMMLAMGGPQLGELEAGLVAALWSAPVAIVTGGVATVLLTAWVAWRQPGLRRYRSDARVDRPGA